MEGGVRPAFTVSQNRPNPFSKETWIGYVLDRPAPVSVRIYDLSGRLVRTLIDEKNAAGARAIVWDGRGSSGEALPSGVYLYRFESAGRLVTKKCVLSR